MKPEELHPTAAALNDDDGRSAYQPGARLARSYRALRAAGWPHTRQVRRAKRRQKEHKRRQPRQRWGKATQMRFWDTRSPEPGYVSAMKEALRDEGWQWEFVAAQKRGDSNGNHRTYTLRCRPPNELKWRYPETLEEIQQWLNEQTR